MWNDLKKILIRWNESTTERQKLQHCYLAFVIIAVLISGIISLINASLGQTLVKIPLVAIAAFVINALTWNLINSLVVVRIHELTKPQKKQ